MTGVKLYATGMLSLSLIGNGAFLFKFFWDHFLNVLRDQTTFDKKFQRQMKVLFFEVFFLEKSLNSDQIKENGKILKMFLEITFLWHYFHSVDYKSNRKSNDNFFYSGEIRSLEYEEITMEFDNDFIEMQMKIAN